jgi:hypothetical protein
MLRVNVSRLRAELERAVLQSGEELARTSFPSSVWINLHGIHTFAATKDAWWIATRSPLSLSRSEPAVRIERTAFADFKRPGPTFSFPVTGWILALTGRAAKRRLVVARFGQRGHGRRRYFAIDASAPKR